MEISEVGVHCRDAGGQARGLHENPRSRLRPSRDAGAPYFTDINTERQGEGK